MSKEPFMSVREVLTVLIVFLLVLALLFLFGISFPTTLFVATISALLAALFLMSPRLR